MAEGIDRGRLTEMFAQDGIAVTPSVYPDHFPNVVAEAMLSGIAVVASDSGGTSEWFENRIGGMWIALRRCRTIRERLTTSA